MSELDDAVRRLKGTMVEKGYLKQNFTNAHDSGRVLHTGNERRLDGTISNTFHSNKARMEQDKHNTEVYTRYKNNNPHKF